MKKIQLLFFTFFISFCSIAQLNNIIQPVKKISQIKLAQTDNNRAFDKQFNNNANGRNDKNAYLLCYLTTLIYPQYLKTMANDIPSNYERDLNNNKKGDDNNFFETEYKRFTQNLFTNAEYAFVSKGNAEGYDPEAMVISTKNTIYVIFRGTDRVARKNVTANNYEIGEWIKTDFDLLQTAAVGMEGKFHKGFWNSISYGSFKEILYNKIQDFGGATKKVWITGHSLGCGQAQLFAMYMGKKGIKATGIYLFASPHAGNEDFAKELDRMYPNGKIQRFEFVDDPITTIPFGIMGYSKVGVRVYYNDIKSIEYNKNERWDSESALILGDGLKGVVGGAITGAVKFDGGKIMNGSKFCFHHPTWYLQAAYRQLDKNEKDLMPRPLSLPSKENEACDALACARGQSANPINQAGAVVEEVAAVVEEGLEKLNYTAKSIIDNVGGYAIPEGNYYISSYGSGGKLYFNDEDGAENGSDMILTTKKQLVKIEKTGVIGYTIRFQKKIIKGWFDTQEEKEYILDCDRYDLYDNGPTTIQLWEKNNVPATNLNQRWLFNRVKNNKYVIANMANLKVLDARNDNIKNSRCGVRTTAAASNDQTQIWILENAN